MRFGFQQFLSYLILATLFLSAPSWGASKADLAKAKIEVLLKEANYKGGIAIKNLHSGAEIAIRGNEMFPMASVFKFPIAIAILRKIEAGDLKHEQSFHLKKTDILNGLRGPIAEKYPHGEIDLTTDALLKYMVSDSDNTACDFLIKIAGGPDAITKELRKLQIDDINISRTESEIMATTNEPGPKGLDATSPLGMIRLYEKLNDGKVLNPDSSAYLMKLMTESNNPPHILNGLPKDLRIAHKSGWCGKDLCLNDTALVTLPNNKGNLVMAIFLKGNVDFKKGSETISKIAKIGFDALAN
jgi:beta-lactamase class A